MPDRVKVDQELELVKVESHGVVTAADITRSLERVMDAHKTLGINHVFVDTTQQELMPGIIAVFDIFAALPSTIRVAILATRDQATVDQLLFAETVTRNRGIRLRVFWDEEEALEWLFAKSA